ncbi:pyrimidine dimer DNA glycosylase/endonuclease V [Rarobacter incanus]|uniref:Pyrimidine dimer DNA glycosylase /DNA-(Apurinic or apyrimidinic site) lyase n=1 Tax=Rarobacter incanus TaxID=153494 RepID=A0A542SQD9_9MICO|nr:pyrimidine dimer DNA glycosylase/endonuclease V [Rarobacter incanus]TQK76805.1 pyrimidine dimer DNA glycosylase /DNA-(apurinic or apyrimidinic site) lyase [Rarobacter incanus]
MRVWSLDPALLDRQGLLACWREALLAQAVLTGRTRGYTRHPQLLRFREQPDPAAAIATYLGAVATEADSRGYSFNRSRIDEHPVSPTMTVSQGQLDFEWDHLQRKLTLRSPQWLESLRARCLAHPAPHPLFRVVPGPVAAWEITHSS